MTQSGEQSSSADEEGASSPKSGPSGASSPPGFADLLARPWLFAGLVIAVGGACWFGAHQVQALTDNPLRLDIFFHLFWVQEMPGVLVYFLIATGALALAFVLPASWGRAVPLWVEKWRFLVCALVFASLAAGSVSVYRAYPVSMDEFTAVQQSEIFSRLRLGGSYPPQLFERLIPEFFLGYFFTPSASGEFVSNYWPGHSLLMAPFSLVGAPWLLNPLLASFSLLLVGFAVRKTVECDNQVLAKDGPVVGRQPEMVGWAILFMLASPEFLANGMSFYSMSVPPLLQSRLCPDASATHGPPSVGGRAGRWNGSGAAPAGAARAVCAALGAVDAVLALQVAAPRALGAGLRADLPVPGRRLVCLSHAASDRTPAEADGSDSL